MKQRVREAQYRALQQVNRRQIQLYWDLGQLIAERQQQHGWGKSIVETLAHNLQTEFVGIAGFSVQTCGTCAVFSWNTKKMNSSHKLGEKFSNHRLEK